MVGTAGLPHVIIRFYTVPKVKDARVSAGWALLFIAILYTTAPAVAAFARSNLITTVNEAQYSKNVLPSIATEKTVDPLATTKMLPDWFKRWEDTGLLAWVDKNQDGRVQYRAGAAFIGKPKFNALKRGNFGQRLITNTPSSGKNELYIDRDIMVLANPEIAKLPNWIIALVAAGALAAALSTAAGLLLVVSTSISHDFLKRTVMPNISERGELLAARISAALAIGVAGYFGIHPPGFVAQVVAFAFGLAASSFFPAILLGIFSKRANREGVVSGMVLGIVFTTSYIVYFKFLGGTKDQWWLGISPEGIGSIGMLVNFVTALTISRFTPPPPPDIQELIENIRRP
jgi:cation/acetate symporter